MKGTTMASAVAVLAVALGFISYGCQRRMEALPDYPVLPRARIAPLNDRISPLKGPGGGDPHVTEEGMVWRTNVFKVEKSEQEPLLKGDLGGAESFLFDKGHTVLTGTSDGRIVEVDLATERFTEIVRTGAAHPRCGSTSMESHCGRPLGLTFHPTLGRPHDTIVVADAGRGLLLVKRSFKEVTVLMPPEGDESGPLKFINSVVVSKNGTIYFTESSTVYPRSEFFRSILMNDMTGRVSKYDIESNKRTVLVDNLGFANGIALKQPNEESLLFVETTRFKIWEYFLSGDLSGSLHQWASLPVVGDNIHYVPHRDSFALGFPALRTPINDFILRSKFLRMLLLALPGQGALRLTLMSSGIYKSSTGFVEFSPTGVPRAVHLDKMFHGSVSDALMLPTPIPANPTSLNSSVSPPPSPSSGSPSPSPPDSSSPSSAQQDILVGSFRHAVPIRVIHAAA